MTANTITLLLNGLTLALALSLLLLLLWQDSRNETNRYFSLFLFSVLIWTAGSMLARAAAFVNAEQQTIQLGLRLLDIGFAASNICLYLYAVVVTGSRGRWFRVAAIAGLAVMLFYEVLLLVTDTPRPYEVTQSGVLHYRFEPSSALLYIIFLSGTVLVIWRNQRKIRARSLVIGILLFVIAQVLGLVSPRLRALGIAENGGSLAALLMSYAVIKQQIMTPLLGRATQLEAVRDVGLAVSSRLRLSETLGTIATQAARILQADGAAIFLMDQTRLVLSAVHNMPEQFVGISIPLGHGIVGTVAVERRGRRVDSYHFEWQGETDLPLAAETFGSVVCTPLMFANEVVGVLLVVHSRQGRLFNHEDVRLLELLGPQAAVAITNSRLFEAERELSSDLASAKNQLETVLSSTRNPVVAIDRNFRIIFANRAAENLVNDRSLPITIGHCIFDLIPPHYFPPRPKRALRDLRSRGVHVYEISLSDQTFLCHIAGLGQIRTDGWVVVLNDVTQLKELDRLKSQMIQMTSHDLKNPLQAAMSYLELLSEDGEDVLSDDMKSYIGYVWNQLTRMYRIISGILDLERIQLGTPVHELCDITAILERVVQDLTAQARSKQVTVTCSTAPTLPDILGDEQQISQALTNLVENAVKFTDSGGIVDVRATVNADHVCIDISDTGIGIPADEQQRVFERFYRGKQQKLAHVHGSGLGLSLVKTIIDNHHGDISLESTVGQGTTFHIRLPAANNS